VVQYYGIGRDEHGRSPNAGGGKKWGESIFSSNDAIQWPSQADWDNGTNYLMCYVNVLRLGVGNEFLTKSIKDSGQ